MSAEQTRCVAVVAVHGVADQKPHATARTIADVLARVDAEDGGRYSAFEEAAIRVSVEPVALDAPDARDVSAASRSATRGRPSLYEVRQTSALFADVRRIASETSRTDRDMSDGFAHASMRDQLSAYVPDVNDSIYETVRLDGVRQSRPVRVHIYEAYWADLSRLKSGVLSAVLELYQLLFYVCSLGRKTIEAARSMDRRQARSRWWSAFAWAHAAVEWPLVLGVPILNLLVLALALVMFVIWIPERSGAVALAGIAGFVTAVAVASAIALYMTRMRFSGPRWPVVGILVAVLAVVAFAAARLLFTGEDPYGRLGLIVFLVLGLLFMLLMAVYQRRRSGAFPLGAILFLGVAFDFAWQLRMRDDPERAAVVQAALGSIELVLLALALCWATIIAGIVATSLTAFGAVRFGTPDERRRAARRAAWTANLAAILPAVAIIILNLALWTAIHAGGTRVLPDLKSSAAAAQKASDSTPTLTTGDCDGPGEICYKKPRFFNVRGGAAGDVISALLNRSLRPLLLIGPIVVLSLLWTAWTLLPAIAAERPRLAGTGEAASVWLGGALTAGFGALRLSGELLRWLFVVLAALGILTALGVIDDEPPAYALLASIATGLGAVATLALTASRGPFRFLALGFRSALDVALDVTNWLRVHPRDRNPRARITARYIALLRHLCQWTDPVSGAKYDRIVIVAHSQGTVISVEVLRFLLREHRAMERAAPELARLRGGPEPLPIDLFTVGCPLRQLYARRFPDLYGWAWHDDAAWPGARPAAASLGVARWMNAYRSGDYVGRYLWHPDSGNVPWARNVASADIREEFCAGPGAHTHYWDQPRPDPIGAALDRLIAR